MPSYIDVTGYYVEVLVKRYTPDNDTDADVKLLQQTVKKPDCVLALETCDIRNQYLRERVGIMFGATW